MVKYFHIWVCALMLASWGSFPPAQAAGSSVSLLSEAQDMKEIEDYVNQKDESEAQKEQSKRRNKVRKPMVPIYSAEK